MRGKTIQEMTVWILAVILFAVLPAAAQEPALQTDDFWVTTDDGFSIHVMRRFMEGRKNVPVLLVHALWGNSKTWDFPGRSVMDYLAVRGYDVYALDLRGMGQSYPRPANYFTIGLLDRVNDVAAVAEDILASTGRKPVIAGWSQGGLLTGLVAAHAPDLVAGVGLFGVPRDSFYLPPEYIPLFEAVIASGVDRYLPSPDVAFAVAFGFDPITGKPTISDEAFQIHASSSEPDSVRVMLEELSPEYFHAVITPVWPNIRVPALVVDGALDILVGEERAQALFDALGSDRKQLFIFPRNHHGWFLEDNSEATLRAFNRFLSEFK